MSDTFKLGDKGEAVIKYGLKRVYADPRTVPKDINTQLKYGDFVCPGFGEIGIQHLKIEVKTEQKYTGNLFFETMSNVDTGRDGWIATSTADELYYLFWDVARGYRIPLFQDVKWQFDYCKNRFKEVDQKKHQQENLTRGRLVPIEWLMSLYVGAVEFDFQKIKENVDKDIKNGDLICRH